MGFVSALLVGRGVAFGHGFWQVPREWRTRGFLAANRARLSGNSVVLESRKPIGSEKENYDFTIYSHDAACLPS